MTTPESYLKGRRLRVSLTGIRLPPPIDREAVLAGLDRVLDPELDESVLSLGFVESVTGDAAGNVEVCLRLPTYWCAANFSYLMASDARRELSAIEGVRSITIKLAEHFASREVEDGAGTGKTFAEAFPGGGPDSLEETRRIFLVKGYFARQERLLRALKDAGLPFEQIAILRVGDAGPARLPITCMKDGRTVSRYLERRAELRLDCSESAPLIVDATGRAIPPEEMEAYYIRARTARLAMEANGSLCSAMLQSRRANWARHSS